MRKNILLIGIFCFFSIMLVGKYFYNKNNSETILGDVIYIAPGDVDMDGKVGSSDYILLKKYILNISSLSMQAKKNADVNSDGKIDSSDYIRIRKMLLGFDSKIILKEDGKVIKTGSTYQILYEVLNDDKKLITFTSSNSNVATVDNNGVVTAIKPGKVKVTAKLNNLSSEMSITVTNKVEVGMWFSTWYSYEEPGSNDHKQDLWKNWDIRYKPLLSNNTFGYYDSNNHDEIMFQLASIASANIDFLIFDQTNNIYVDNGFIYKRALKTVEYITEYNDSNVNKIYYCSAIGGIQWKNTIEEKGESIEYEAEILWNNFVNSKYGKYHYYYNHKPVLVIYGDGGEDAWNKYTGDKTYSNKFSIFYADNNSKPGYWGWAYDEGVKLNKQSIVVMPGWHNKNDHQVKRNNGKTYKEFWNAVLDYAYLPKFVIINSFNEYAEGTAIWPADTKDIPKSEHKDDNDVWYDETGQKIDPYYYWNLTLDYLNKLKNK